MKSNSYQLKIDLVKELKRISDTQSLNWIQDKYGNYECDLKDFSVKVEFICLSRKDELNHDYFVDDSDPTIVGLWINNYQKTTTDGETLGILLDFAIGTEGFELISEMLCNADKVRKQAWQKGIKKMNSILDNLKSIP